MIPALDALDLTAVIDIYQTQRTMMPSAVPGARRKRRALIDILDEFDGLILDGYGVINVGANLVAGFPAHRRAVCRTSVGFVMHGWSC